MRTAIRTYQSGGQILDDRYFPREQGDVTGPVTSSPQTVQPMSPPPPPPPQQMPSGTQIDANAPPPPFVQPQAGPPPTAIQTAPQMGTEFEDHDVDLPRKTEMETQAWKNTRSHRGGRDIVNDAPEPVKIEDNALWPDYQRALQIFNTWDAKTQKAKRGQLDTMYRRMENETNRVNKQAQSSFTAKHKEALQKADEERVNQLKIPELNGLIDDGLLKQADPYDKVIKSGSTQDAEQAALRRKMSPLDSMTNTEQKYVIRQIMGLNRDLDADQASQVLVLIGSSPEYGKPGINGLKGRAATNYKADSSDAIGNRQITVPTFGTVRISPEMLNLVEKRRLQGYDAGLKFKQEAAAKRAEAAKPDWFTRNVTQPATDYLSRQIR